MNAIGWDITRAYVGWRVRIWSGDELIYRGYARTRKAAEQLAASMRMKLLPEAFRRDEKEVSA